MSCVNTPDSEDTSVDSGQLIVLCEGLWGMNNSSINLVDTKNLETELNYFENTNGQILGDLASNIVKKDNNYYVLVSGSNLLYELDIDFRIMREFNFTDQLFIKNFAYFKDDLILLTDLDKSELILFDLNEFKVIKAVGTGPGPEDIEFSDDYIFVANSAKGEILDNDDNSRSVFIYDHDLNFIDKITSMPNTLNLAKNANSLFVAYPNFRWRPDSTGGIIEYDINTLELKNHYKTNCYSDLQIINNKIYFLNQYGLNNIDLNNGSINEKIIENNTNDIWFDFRLYNNEFWILNSKQHTSNGKLMQFSNDQLINEFNVGLNPVDIIFLDRSLELD